VKRAAIVLAPGAGRDYPMGRISARFKADGVETASRYSIPEWWLEPHTANRRRTPTAGRSFETRCAR